MRSTISNILLNNRLVALGLAAFAVLPPTLAAGPHPKINLDWQRAGEALTYQSCGCADACWSAELKRAGKRVARLRCDCEKLYFAKDREPEHLLAETCTAFEAEGKMTLITQRMNDLVPKPNAKQSSTPP